MECVAECSPCYLKQVISAFEAAGLPQERQKEIIKEVSKMIPDVDDTRSPAENSSILLLEAYRLMGIDDPFKEAKERSNIFAMELYPRLRNMVLNAEDSLMMAIKMAAAGNIIDMGILREFDVDKSIEDALSMGFALCDYEQFRDFLNKARKILIIGDNSGEIVFDKLLVEQLKRYHVDIIYSVKSGPILNDSTMEDAIMVGMDKMADIIENGNRYLGTVLDACSEEFIQAYKDTDLVISKGQGNYESLEGKEIAGDKTFFIFRAKCPWVAKRASVNYMDLVFCQNRMRD